MEDKEEKEKKAKRKLKESEPLHFAATVMSKLISSVRATVLSTE